MPFALIVNDTVHELFDEKPDLYPKLDVRDVSAIKDISLGWLVKGGTYEAPPILQPAAPIVITYKADVYRRCTDQEAEAIEVALASTTVRSRRLFEESQFLNHADPVFATLREAMIGMFGEDRADALLAAS